MIILVTTNNKRMITERPHPRLRRPLLSSRRSHSLRRDYRYYDCCKTYVEDDDDDEEGIKKVASNCLKIEYVIVRGMWIHD